MASGAPLDAHVAAALDTRADDNDDSDDEALAAALEDEALPPGLRERRLQQLHDELAREKRLREQGNGSLEQLAGDEAVLAATTSNARCVVHFSKPDFQRCRLMDARLRELAAAHVDTRFVAVPVDSVPFLVARLRVQVLPCVLAFVDAVVADRIVGFEGVGPGTDAFTAAHLEQRLLRCRVLERAKIRPAPDAASRKSRSSNTDRDRDNDADDDDGDDWD